MMIERLIESMKAKYKSEPISLDAYQSWRHNPVTERLMEELEVQAMEVTLTLPDRESDRDLQLSRGAIATATSVISWIPQEVLEDMPDED